MRLLGSGTSSGVPRLGIDGPDWGQCDPQEPRNRRTRASILVESATTRLLIDTSPDLREQLLLVGAPPISAVLWTHDHADHVHGIDDLRQLFLARGVPVLAYARPETLRKLVNRFHYAFNGNGGYPALIDGRALERDILIGDIGVRFIDMPHGGITSAGFTFTCGQKKIGYATDFSHFTAAMSAFFKGCDLLVIDALRRKPHPTHPHLSITLAGIASCTPNRAVLMHMDGSMDYETLRNELPLDVEPGYDGMEVEVG